jgi:sulfite reductase (NADPH) flavoprotein alpha-component
MSLPLANAPLSEDQIALVTHLLVNATPEQRVWLAGYVAGFQAANDVCPAPSAAVAPKPGLTILYGSESGNAEALAAAARRESARLGFAVRMLDMADTSPAELPRLGTVLVIVSTWGDGEPPQRAEAFHSALMAADAQRLDGLRYAVLALGDRAYARFCEIGRQMDARLAELGARRLAERVDCDLDYKQTALSWIATTLRQMTETQSESRAAVIHVDFGRGSATEDDAVPTEAIDAEVTAHINLNSVRSDIETYHIELSLAGTGLAYQPGDAISFLPHNDAALVAEVLDLVGQTGNETLRAELMERRDVTTLTPGQVTEYAALTGNASLQDLAADESKLHDYLHNRQFIDLLQAAPRALSVAQLSGLLRPLPPRAYSAASSQRAVGEEVHLLVAKVAWESHGRARYGVASTDAARNRKPGAKIAIMVRPNPRFRLPADPAVPVIMIGPGTGVAPFRAFLQEREALGARGPNWLFFGARRFTHDFLYQLEWQEWLKSSLLTRISLAFSRDQREKVYVQHRMWEERRELYGWLHDGAHVYVCGDATAMARDVHAMLLDVIADQSGRGPEAAQAELRELQRAGRYRRDVY